MAAPAEANSVTFAGFATKVGIDIIPQGAIDKESGSVTNQDNATGKTY
jgi:hypothetical protein